MAIPIRRRRRIGRLWAMSRQRFPHDEVEPSLDSFLEMDPPHWLARGLVYLLLFLFAGVVLLSILVRLPETVSGRFVLTPIHRTDAVRAPQSGMLAEIAVAEGQMVQEGAALLIVRPFDLGGHPAEPGTIATARPGVPVALVDPGDGLEGEQAAARLELERSEEWLRHLDATIAARQRRLAETHEQLGRSLRLLERGLRRWVDYSDDRFAWAEASMDLQDSLSEREETLSSVDHLRHLANDGGAERAESARSGAQRTGGSESATPAAKSDRLGRRGADVAVTAPCSGIVLRLQPPVVGAWVERGRRLVEIACSGERLQAELILPEAGSTLVREGQAVQLLYDAFPRQRHGVRYGVVRWVARAPVAVDDRASVVVWADLSDDAVAGEGRRGALRPGMRGIARIVVGSRSLMGHAFEPLRRLRETWAEPPAAGDGSLESRDDDAA